MGWRYQRMAAGQRYGRLTAIAFDHRSDGTNYWLFRCDCGNEHVTRVASVRSGGTQSCGCFRLERTAERSVVHGHCKVAGFEAWRAMIARCYNASNPRFASYGGRGIIVCDRWRFGDGERAGFECFIADLGPKPSKRHSLDRTDNDGNYTLENCRWATPAVQMNNRRTTITVDTPWGVMPLKHLSKRTGIPYAALLSRLKRGWQHDRLTEPLHFSK